MRLTLPGLAIDWNVNPLAFMELLVVLAFGIGWWVLERHANRIDQRRKSEAEDAEKQRSPPTE